MTRPCPHKESSRTIDLDTKEWICLDCEMRLDNEHVRLAELLENLEEKCAALVKHMRQDRPEAVMAVITELGLMFPPSEGDGK